MFLTKIFFLCLKANISFPNMHALYALLAGSADGEEALTQGGGGGGAEWRHCTVRVGDFICRLICVAIYTLMSKINLWEVDPAPPAQRSTSLAFLLDTRVFISQELGPGSAGMMRSVTCFLLLAAVKWLPNPTIFKSGTVLPLHKFQSQHVRSTHKHETRSKMMWGNKFLLFTIPLPNAFSSFDRPLRVCTSFLPAAKPRRSMDGKPPPSSPGEIESLEAFRGQISMGT